MSDKAARVALVKEVMDTMNIRSRGALCGALGYAGTSTTPLVNWETKGTLSFKNRLRDYLENLDPRVLKEMPSVSLVFPDILDNEEKDQSDVPSLDSLSLTASHKPYQNMTESKLATCPELADLWLHSKNEHNVLGILPHLTSRTKHWILKHIVPVPKGGNVTEVVPWVWSRRTSILVAHGSQEISPNSLLLQGFTTLRPAQYMFFKRCSRGSELLDREIIDALTFLGYAGILIVLSEFQEDGGFLAAIIKEMQDMGNGSTHELGMLLFGSDRIAVRQVTTQVFYSIRSVRVLADPIPEKWLKNS